MAEYLRDNPTEYGLVLANGGWMTKEAAGVWSCVPKKSFERPLEAAKSPEKVPISPDPSTGVIETYTVTHGKDGPASGIIFARTETGERFIAVAAPEALPRLLEEKSPVGLSVTVTTQDERNTFTFT
ncbi:MAG: hypothetical protein AAGJ85_01775 [Pseudomonadota bacterium]